MFVYHARSQSFQNSPPQGNSLLRCAAYSGAQPCEQSCCPLEIAGKRRRAGPVALLRFVMGKSLTMLPLNGLIKAEMPLAGAR
jgi:hypothetical protein